MGSDFFAWLVSAAIATAAGGQPAPAAEPPAPVPLAAAERVGLPARLGVERAGDFYTFTWGPVFEDWSITAQGAQQVGCSDRGIWPPEVGRAVATWIESRRASLAMSA